MDLALLIGVVAVVVIVSLPRLTAFAQRENEADAQRLVRRLAQLFDEDSLSSSPPRDTRALFERLPKAARRQFEDQTILEDGRLVLRHGYYFEFVRVPSFAGDTEGWMAVRAWPERAAPKGTPAYFGFSGNVVLSHSSLSPAPFGPDAPPQIRSPLPFDLQAHGWRSVNPLQGD